MIEGEYAEDEQYEKAQMMLDEQKELIKRRTFLKNKLKK
jgi:hypothetical protein